MPVLNWDPFFVPRTDPWRTGHLTFAEAPKTGSAVAAVTLIQCRDVPIFTLCDVTYRPTI